ncbi:MAG: DUF1523 family protein [Pseudomonadota bacterium]
MRYLRWSFFVVFWTFVVAFLHYTLPQTDIVRIVNTYEERQELGDWTRIFWSVPDTQSEGLINRDVQFIQTVRANGRPMVYRNEDTGWGWPPYYKFDTANLYTEANDGISTRENPKWHAMRHYGWRNEFLSIFPNAVAIWEVEGPDVRIIPWVNILILAVLAALYWAIRVRWLRFRRNRIDPTLEEITDSWEAAGDAVDDRRNRIRRWLDTWRAN